MKPIISNAFFAAALTIAMPTVASAASFQTLVGDGYEVGKMSRSASGMSGWILSNGKDKYFCRLDATMALTKTKIIAMITGGRTIEIDRKTFESKSSTDGMPQFADLKAGKPRPEDVGACSKAK